MGNDDVAKANDTSSVDRKPEQHVCAVGDDRPLDVHLYGFSAEIERPCPGLRNMAQGQTRMLREIVWLNGLAVPRQIRRTCANDLCQVGDLAACKRRLVEWAYAKSA